MKVAEIVSHADHAGGHDQRRGEQRRPDEEERNEAAGEVLVRLAQVDIRAARGRHRGAELRPHQPVGHGENGSQDPADERLRPSQPMSACGPPIAEIMSGIVMKGPIPTICDMLTVVAGNRLSAFTKPWSLPCAVSSAVMALPASSISHFLLSTSPSHNSSALTIPKQALLRA